MKVYNLKIKNLHDLYNYDVSFNDDITFLYGANGSGKTTILNIIEAITTGSLYKLFQFKFNKIEVFYGNEKKTQKIKILDDRFNRRIKVFFQDNEYFINEIEVKRVTSSDHRELTELRNLYFRENEIMNVLKKTFNYVYLPLDRNINITDSNSEYEYYRTRIRNRQFNLNNNYINDFDSLDFKILKIQNIIEDQYMIMSAKTGKINDNFRNDIIESILDINVEYSENTFYRELSNSEIIKKIKRTKNSYNKMLKELKLDREDASFDKKAYFFDDLINDVVEIRNNSEKTTIDMLLKFNELSRIEKLINYANTLEKEKTKIWYPLEQFLFTMNDFVKDNSDHKFFYTDDRGRIMFKSNNNLNPISIQHLSSGEKQLITYFTHLYFDVGRKDKGIFVVDEPELSLHLSWQRKFIERTIEINNNIQLIFATHSPEIIGKFRNKMFELVRIPNESK